jgi:hypothetical protein
MPSAQCIIEPLEPRVNLSTGPSLIGTLPYVFQPLASGTLKIHLPDANWVTQTEKVTTSIYASTDRKLDAGDLLIGEMTTLVALKHPGTTLAVPFILPATVGRGEYYLIAEVQASAGIGAGIAVSQHAVFLQPPVSDLAISAVAAPATPFLLNKLETPHRVTARVVNSGNVPVSSAATVQFYLSTSAELNGSDPLLATASVTAVTLKPNQSLLVSVNITLPAGTPVGRYLVFAVLTPENSVTDSVAANDVSASSRTLLVLKHLPSKNSDTTTDVGDTNSTFYDGTDYYYDDKGEYGYANQTPTSQPAPTSMPKPTEDGNNTEDGSDDDGGDDDGGDDGADDGGDDGGGGDDSDTVHSVRISVTASPFSTVGIADVVA